MTSTPVAFAQSEPLIAGDAHVRPSTATITIETTIPGQWILVPGGTNPVSEASFRERHLLRDLTTQFATMRINALRFREECPDQEALLKTQSRVSVLRLPLLAGE